MVTTVDCLLVTQRGFVFLDLPWDQLKQAHQQQKRLPEGEQMVWEISSQDGRSYEAVDILAKYRINPKAGDGDGL